MPVLVILIVISLSFYVFYKLKFFRCNRPLEKQWISGKSRIALGAFVALFGINQLFLSGSTVSYIVGAVFIVVGGLSIWAGYKTYQFYLPKAILEAEELAKKSR
ncbi:hypothetical protein CVD25_15230 [Bacillus canaveralius]|uniref:YtpI family protein n=1 Tax=Bacillus canaveralius TaxID=1403243 RepID=A0A2N5GFH9_9BACI|nr:MULTISPECIES: YtpI family protein [Bacillus]PLR79507.1 hypothetical protein CU635_22920 [Bacillus canaveralius]PLR82333.1 hypothetical protein CVD23_16935 [Bacillus sp. V33-4]PLR95161.1 hypothetical protein CVD25_15230 [Bacillus canaveralius]RSK55859.1 hypothetical protein EJA13_02995 [Bacillus canaveralius]